MMENRTWTKMEKIVMIPKNLKTRLRVSLNLHIKISIRKLIWKLKMKKKM